MIEILGNYPVLQRVRTGLFSLDMALRGGGELGYPLRTIVELYGRPESGKSTLAYYLSGSTAKTGKIFLCDVDKILDKNYLIRAIGASGFSGRVDIANSTDEKGKPLTHEKMLMNMTNALKDNDTRSVILDSVGGIAPSVEMEEEEEFGQAFMGKRAKLVGQVVRAMSHHLRNKEEPSTALVVNHVHNVLAGHGHSTPGGETLKFKATSRIMIWTKEVLREGADNDGELLGYLVNGVMEKHTFGGKGRSFSYYIVPEYGVHVGASAMFDCVTYGLAERKTRVKLGDKSVGYLKADLLAYARDGKERKFDVFREALAKYENSLMRRGIENADDAGHTADATETD